MTKRLFIAVPIPENIKKTLNLCQHQLIKIYGNRGVVYSDSMHLTLKFLGNTEIRDIDKICNCIEINMKNIHRFDLNLNEIGCFQNCNYPKVIFCSLSPEENILKLAKGIDESLSQIGFEREKKSFKPHITIFRPKLIKALNLDQFKINGEMTVKSVKIYESILKPDRAYYKVIRDFELI